MIVWLSAARNKLGDFWFYSLVVFFASRAADCLNAFVGLWLVPKYVGPSELGAVVPLTNLANLFALPAAVFAYTFRNELSNLAVNHKFGQMKTLMKSVFAATVLFFLVAIVVAKLTLPMFLERIRIAEGSLSMIILTCSFISAIAPIYTNALQSLKKFRQYSIINLVCAPARLLVMLATMPLRALTGYFVGQTTTPILSIIASVLFLRKELRVSAEHYWNREVFKHFSKLFLIFSIISLNSSLVSLIETTILRQRLPEIDSAAYYMVTRFSDIATFLSSTLIFTIFPFTAELGNQNKSTFSILLKASLAILAFNIILALGFYLVGERMLSILPHGRDFSPFAWAIPCTIGITTLQAILSLCTTAEISANRFSFLKVILPIDAVYMFALLAITGYGYFSNNIPDSWTSFLAIHNICSLKTILIWFAGSALIRLLAFFSYKFKTHS